MYYYLQRTKSLSLIYQEDYKLKLVGYINSNWEGDKKTRYSNSKYAFTLADMLVLWFLQKQNSVALLFTKAKYIAVAKAIKKTIWITIFLKN